MPGVSIQNGLYILSEMGDGVLLACNLLDLRGVTYAPLTTLIVESLKRTFFVWLPFSF